MKALEARNVFGFFSGVLLSRLGDSFSFLAFVILILKVTNSNAMVSLFMVMRYVPGTILGITGAGFIDRYDKRMILLLTYIASAILTAAVCLNSQSIIWLLSCTILLGVMHGIYVPCQRAYLVEIFSIEKAKQANSFLQLAESLAKTAGFFVAGQLIERVGLLWAFGIDAISFVIISFAVLLTKTHKHVVHRKENIQINKNLRWFINQQNLLIPSLIFSFTWLSTGAMFSLEAGYAKQYLHATDSMIGLLFSLATLGAFIGIAFLLKKPSPKNYETWKRTLTLYCAGEILFVIAYGLTNRIEMAYIFIILYGWCLTARNILISTYFHKSTPAQIHGAVFSCHQSLSNFFMIAGMGLAGPLCRWMNLREVIVGVALFSGVVLLVLYNKKIFVDQKLDF